MRQPKAWPIAVPAGTPMMVATVMPAKTSEMAEPRLSGVTIETARIAARPKKVPWLSDTSMRAARRIS